MNEALENYVSYTDDRYNFVAFSVEHIKEVSPYVSDFFNNLLNLWTGNNQAIKISFLVATVFLAALVVYLVFKVSASMKKHKRIHVHHYAGFNGDDE